MSVPSGVRKGFEIDTETLGQYLRQHVSHFKYPIVYFAQFQGGQSNPTYYFRDQANQEFVLRKKPPGKLLPTAHMVEREYVIMKALENTGVPVPKCYCLCEDPTIIGTAFFVMQFLQGRVFRDPTLPDLSPQERRAIYTQMVEVMAKLHTVDWQRLGLSGFGKQGNYFSRQISRWSQNYKASETTPIPNMDSLIGWLPNNIPQDDTVSIAHGDYRLENMMFHPTEPRIVAILDWEISTLGHPLADLSYNCISYYTTAISFTEGIPTEQEYLDMYCKISHRPKIEKWNFYMAFSMFKMCAITQGIRKRIQQGNAAHASAEVIASFTETFAEIGWRVAQTPELEPEPEPAEQQSDLFYISKEAKLTIAKLTKFLNEVVIPNEPVFLSQVSTDPATRWKSYPEIMEQMKALAKAAGLWNLWLPKEYNGKFTCVEYAQMAEITGRSLIGAEVFNCSAPDTGNMEVLFLFGSPEQKKTWLEPLLDGSIRSCFAMTEPAVASSDARNITTTIHRVGDKLVINGRKWYISGAGDPRCKIAIVMGKSVNANNEELGHSFVLVPMDTPGLNVVRACDVLGFDDAPHGHMDLTFSNVTVPVSNLIGEEGQGFLMAQSRLGPGRIHHCMRLIGLASRSLEEACRRVSSRKAFGKYLYQQGTVQANIADSLAEIEQSRLLVLKAAHGMDHNIGGFREIQALISMAKLVVPKMACNVIDRAIQVHGAAGLSQDTFLGLAYIAARSLRLADGPDEVHRMFIARTELKKYIQQSRL